MVGILPFLVQWIAFSQLGSQISHLRYPDKSYWSLLSDFKNIPENEVEKYLPQVCTILIDRDSTQDPDIFSYLERILADKCAGCLTFGLRAWSLLKASAQGPSEGLFRNVLSGNSAAQYREERLRYLIDLIESATMQGNGLPEKVEYLRSIYFRDIVFMLDSLARLGVELKQYPVSQRNINLRNALAQLNTLLFNRMMTKGKYGLQQSSHHLSHLGSEGYYTNNIASTDPRSSHITHQIAQRCPEIADYTVHLPLQHCDEKTLRILRFVENECEVLPSKDRCPYLLVCEVLERPYTCKSDRLYAQSEACQSSIMSTNTQHLLEHHSSSSHHSDTLTTSSTTNTQRDNHHNDEDFSSQNNSNSNSNSNSHSKPDLFQQYDNNMNDIPSTYHSRNHYVNPSFVDPPPSPSSMSSSTDTVYGHESSIYSSSSSSTKHHTQVNENVQTFARDDHPISSPSHHQPTSTSTSIANDSSSNNNNNHSHRKSIHTSDEIDSDNTVHVHFATTVDNRVTQEVHVNDNDSVLSDMTTEMSENELTTTVNRKQSVEDSAVDGNNTMTRTSTSTSTSASSPTTSKSSTPITIKRSAVLDRHKRHRTYSHEIRGGSTSAESSHHPIFDPSYIDGYGYEYSDDRDNRNSYSNTYPAYNSNQGSESDYYQDISPPQQHPSSRAMYSQSAESVSRNIYEQQQQQYSSGGYTQQPQQQQRPYATSSYPPNEPTLNNAMTSSRVAFIRGKTANEKKELVRATSAFGHLSGWNLKSFIVKSGDDLKKEILAMQLIEYCQQVFLAEGINILLRPYQIICTGSQVGLIEFLEGTKSIDRIKKSIIRDDMTATLLPTLKDYFEFNFGPSYTFIHSQAVLNFMKSLVGYSLVTYVLQVKDRHNANILVSNDGSIIHIDFGFILGESPGFNMNWENAPFKLTKEYIDVLGGIDSVNFKEFEELFIKGFLALQKHIDGMYAIVQAFYGDRRRGAADALRSRVLFAQSHNDIVGLIRDSLDNWRTKNYDWYQQKTNNIVM